MEISPVFKVTAGLLMATVMTIFYINKPSTGVVPELPNTWWGPGTENLQTDKTVRQFEILFTKAQVNDLKSRLKNTRDLAPPLKGTGWSYGTNGTFLKKNIVDYWLNKYDFKKRLAYLNKYDQFKTNIQGLDIHFIHVKPKNTQGKNVLPLLILHGWPGSVREFYELIPMLTSPQADHDFVFEVIAPSLPGFGFSSSAVRPGLGAKEMAVVMMNLMRRLSFDKFYTQGGDWGAKICGQMATLFPEHLLGIHLNYCYLAEWKSVFKIFLYSFFPSLLLPKEDHHLLYPMKKHFFKTLLETGYLHIQATKPDTVGIGLSDSPAALAGYVLEKFSYGTNPSYQSKDDGGIYEKFTPDTLIDNLMIYWISNSITTSMRLYAESLNSFSRLSELSWPIKVPTACAQFPHELFYYPPKLLQDKYLNLIQVTRMPRGGHFPALEEPKLLSDDIWKFTAATFNSSKLSETKKDEF
ncbi:Similar to EH2: Juvenile hormone epoxide hydrolase 2 (Ctenocephalides felis) [Cotesia congregata]|uniref:Epoxide hydrolase n=1 Tax=Cotesia congregata TaxID=51543 RepID=A0A8J2MJY9_COTCN|nr:Similar to EH2: Juvenile hormone epoxide hydrolase 2 (Ctenocephalides felis) [Cotesia congregata]